MKTKIAITKRPQPDCLRRRLSKLLTMAMAFIVALAANQAAVAQFGHSDIDFGLEGNKIITNKRVYDSFFPTFGISRQFTSNPGFAAESDGLGTLGSQHDVIYDVLDDLLLWDGEAILPPKSDVRIRIDNNPPGSGSTFVDAQSGLQLGSLDPPTNRIGASSASGEVHSHVNFFLESTDDDTPFGAYAFQLAVSTDSDEIIDSDPLFVVFNYGLDAATFENGLLEFEMLLDSIGVVGDFDGSGTLGICDIDLLADAIRDNSEDPQFDVNNDAQLNDVDRTYWVEQLRKTYIGDANMDGEFSSADFVAVFQRGEYEDEVNGNSTWAEGDWNGDREFDSGDFVLAFQSGGYEKGPRAAVAVPEPMTLRLMGIAVVATLARLRAAQLGSATLAQL